MKKAALVVISVVVMAAVTLIVRSRHGSGPTAPRPSVPPATREVRVPPPPRAPASPAPGEPAYFPPLDRLNDPGATVREDLQVLASMFRDFQETVKDPSGNPIGDNAEIVHALQGHNRGRVVYIPSNHPALNARGELVDRWGTPYFFHAMSGVHMEIRSAGPDRRMWTDDDAVFPPPLHSPGGP